MTQSASLTIKCNFTPKRVAAQLLPQLLYCPTEHIRSSDTLPQETLNYGVNLTVLIWCKLTHTLRASLHPFMETLHDYVQCNFTPKLVAAGLPPVLV